MTRAPSPSAELALLGERIGSASVVGLGESHADASNIAFRNELVRYLHESLGFERVVLEAGLLSCQRADAALAAGMPAPQAAAQCAFGWQTCSAEFIELFEYLAHTRRGPQPLALSGMDPQLSGSAAREQLIPLLEAELGAPLEPRTREAITHLFDLNLRRSDSERRDDRRQLDQLATKVNDALGKESFWARVVDGLLFLDEDHWSYQQVKDVTVAMGNARDLQMAMNVLWLKRQYPGERFILIAENNHLRRRSPVGLQCDDPAHRHGPGIGVTMGQTLADALGSDYFVLGMSAASGAWGRPRDPAEPLGPARPGVLEHAALEASGERVLLDSTRLQRLGAVPSLVLGRGERSFLWGEVYDAVWVSRTTTPHRMLASCPPKRP